MTYQEIFAQNLKRKMEEQGKTHIDLVRDLGIPSPTVTTWTSGMRMPKLDKMQQLADYFHTTVFELIEDGETYRIRNQATQLQRMFYELDEHGRDIVMTVLQKEYEYKKSRP